MLQPVSYDRLVRPPPLRLPCPRAYHAFMSDEYDDENFSSDDEYGEGGIPADLEADIEERINQAAEDRAHELYNDPSPRSGGCLLILALPVLGLWLLR